MNAVRRLAKADQRDALQKAREITSPWSRAQALALVIRYAEQNPIRVADEAARTASLCSDAYQQCAVRAWEIAALAERSDSGDVRDRLKTVLSRINQVEPPASRSEALVLLLSAAARIDTGAVTTVAERIVRVTNRHFHWRCRRAAVCAVGILFRFSPDTAARLAQSVADAKVRRKCEAAIASGGQSPRDFFW